jgi:glycosyltransferase involved in cell wall biosynthesis
VPNCRRASVVTPGPKQPLVLAAGRVWDAAKGIDALCRVAPSLGVRVVVAGEGEAADVDALGVLPFAELAALMAQAAVFAAPARYEPFGLSVLEAGLAGCALVLGDIASLREVWGDAATYVQDDVSLAAAVVGALADPARGGRSPHPRAHLHARAHGCRVREGLRRMRIAIFCHSLMSDWNHGNAHFLRGVVTDLLDRGHDVRVFEPLTRGAAPTSSSTRGAARSTTCSVRSPRCAAGSTTRWSPTCRR